VAKVSCRPGLASGAGRPLSHYGWEPRASAATAPGLVRYAGNPIINFTGSGWLAVNLFSPLVFVDPTDATKLIMVLNAVDGPPTTGVLHTGIFTATVSDPYHWTPSPANPYLTGTWCSGIVIVGTTVYLYSGPNATNNIDRYVSSNLTAANAAAGTVTFTLAANVLSKSGIETNIYYPTVWRKDSTHWYMAYAYDTASAHVPAVRLATSSDGLVWTSTPLDLITIGPPGSFDDTYLEGVLLQIIDGMLTLTSNAYNGPPQPATAPDSMYTFGMAGSPEVTDGWMKSPFAPVFAASLVPARLTGFHVLPPWLKLGTTWYLFYQAANASCCVLWRQLLVCCMATAVRFTPVQFLPGGRSGALYSDRPQHGISRCALGEFHSSTANRPCCHRNSHDYPE
jgi:hypothetical protein